MTNFYKYEVVVIKLPFASSLKYKARPAVIISSDIYNKSDRNTLLILAISSQIRSKVEIETPLCFWKDAGLLKPSLFKMSIATVSQENILHILGSLQQDDIKLLETQLKKMCL